MKLRNKFIFGASGILIIGMFLSIVIVAIIINKQNRKASEDLLCKSFNVIGDAISERQYNLMCDSRQMATANNMVGKMKFLVENRSMFDFVTIKPTYDEITEGIYNIGRTAHVWKAVIYDFNGEPVSFFTIDEDSIYLGYVHNSARPICGLASLRPGDKLKYESWNTRPFLQDIESKFGEEIPTREAVKFKVVDGFLCLISYVPIIGRIYNRETQMFDTKQLGLLMATQRFDNAFVNRMSRLTGTRINIFTKEGLSIGSLREYKSFDLNSFEEAGWQNAPARQDVFLNDITLDGESYYQGVLPIYSESKCLSAIVSLYSKDIGRANTLQMIKLLGMVFLACILFVLPFTIGFSNSLARPISRVVAGLREMARGEGDAAMRVDVKSKDEVRELEKGFNVFVTTIKKAQDQLRQLSKNIITSQEKERRAIARELHDELGQMLTALRMDAVWIKEHLKKNDPKAADRALTMCNLIDKSIDDVQGMALRLRPRLLDDLGLIPALDWYIGDFERRTGVVCSFENADVPHLNDLQTTAVYRIVQESLTNVARHALATHVKIFLQGQDGMLALTVEDDGGGFDTRRISDPDCLGIAGMRERVALVGGTIEIKALPGQGTRLSCRMPINGQEEQGVCHQTC